MRNIILLLSTLMVLSGCAKQQLYTWEKYPSTLYKYKKEPTDENLQKHKEMLLAIIKSSEEKELRVPPGIFCECGFLLLKEGKKEDALKYFDLEVKTYPESTVFVQNLKSYIQRPNNSGTPHGTSSIDNNATEIKKGGL